MIADVAQAFLKALDSQARTRFGRLPDLAKRLDDCLAAAKTAHPQLVVEDAAFVAHVGGFIHVGSDDEAERILQNLKLADLYLAFACSRGDALAHQQLEASMLSGIRAGLTKLADDSGGWLDDFMQEARIQLLVSGAERPPGILKYGGRGSLFSWLNVVLRRDARRWLMKNRGRDIVGTRDDLATTFAEAAAAPDVALIKGSLREEFKAALRAAVSTLDRRSHALLALHVVEGLSFKQIGFVYRVHRTTAMRWIEETKGKLLQQCGQRLMSRLRLRDSQLVSAIQLISSDLHVTLPLELDAC